MLTCGVAATALWEYALTADINIVFPLTPVWCQYCAFM